MKPPSGLKKQTQNKPNFKGKKMLLHLTVNGRFSAHFLDSEKKMCFWTYFT